MMRECYLILKRVLINLTYGGFLNDESELILWFYWLSSSCEFSVDISALDPLVHGVSHDKLNSALGKGAAVTTGGLGVITAGVFLAGEMAGSGVLALPNAMLGTGEIQTSNMLVVQHVLH